MEIVLDGERGFALQTDPETVGDALVAINDYLLGKGRGLQEIVSDGEAVPAEQLTLEFGRRPVSEVRLLEIVSADLLELARESIKDIKEVLPELPAVCQGLSQVLGGDSPQDGFGGFNQLLEIWEALKERECQIVAALGVEMEALEVSGTSLATADGQVHDVLDKARKAMERSDYAGLSQLLAYDAFSLAERETEIVALLESML